MGASSQQGSFWLPGKLLELKKAGVRAATNRPAPTLRPLSFRGFTGHKRWLMALLALAAATVPAKGFAWGSEGHKVVTAIAQAYLTPVARSNAEAILSGDPDTLTPPDLVSRSTWADAWRGSGHRETAQWHFVDIELDNPDVAAACFGDPPPLPLASLGPAGSCVIDRINAFTAELRNPQTPQAERVLALKYVLHLVGDLHQPLHASDSHDRGGNCVLLSLGGARTQNLHSYWDTSVVKAMGSDPVALAAELRARITPAQKVLWERGTPRDWAMEAFAVARSTAYRLPSSAKCGGDEGPVALPSGYAEAAQSAAALQLERAGVRLALVLNQALATRRSTDRTAAPLGAASETLDPPITDGRSARSILCSSRADSMNLHGKNRQRFRRRCLRE